MSAQATQPGLSSDERSKIRSTILSTRHTLEEEVRRQLERYGIYEDERVPLDALSHLSIEEKHVRETIDAALERELESTEGDLERSVTNYVREAVKTYLNRFVALKALEVRDLVTETLEQRPEYGNRSYMHYTVDEIAGELTNARDDGFGAALNLAYQEIGAEIQIIFDETEYTAIDLDPQVREEVLAELDEISKDAWRSDEVLGWVYQYFGEEEREEINTRVDEQNEKVSGTDIATKTQLFTPRYIVEWIVDNSLGRLWLEMYGDRTEIAEEQNCFYLTPVEDSLIDREERDAESITILDPACGSGHMLFYAFDVLYQMYLEQGDIPEEYIPQEILQNNLYGIDIDSGSAQITALSLYLKAKEHAPETEIPQINIASADAVLINGEKKDEVLERTNSELEAEILEQVWESFDNIREWGSLVRVEEQIEKIIDEYREEIEAEGQSRFTRAGNLEKQGSIVSFAEGQSESWETVKKRLLENTRELARIALEQDNPVDEMFAGEVSKTVELLDVLIQDYDVVTTNPPYLQSKKMGEVLKEYVRANYTGKYDVYGAFIERCLEFAKAEGHVGMVTPEKFMSLYYFRGLRKKLLNESYFIDAAHLRRYSFDQQKDRYTISFILRPETPTEDELSRFLRLSHEREEYSTYEKKISGLQSITESLRGESEHNDAYVVSQHRFNDIGRRPFLYWFGEETLRLFSEYPQLDDVADVKVGLQTDDDERFVRKWWEVPKNKIGERYIRFHMSGTDSIYYDYAADYVDWKNSGEDIEDAGGNFRNPDYYFKEGISYRNFGKHMVGRLHEKGDIFSHSSHFVYPNEHEIEEVLAHLNSTIHRFIANGLNPGLHFEAGDVKRLPIKNELENRNLYCSLVGDGIERRKELSALSETSFDYDPESFISSITYKGPFGLNRAEDIANASLYLIHGKVDDLLFEEYDIPDRIQQDMYSNLPKNVSHYPRLDNNNENHSIEENTETTELDQAQFQSLLDDLAAANDVDLRELAHDHEVSPLSIAHVRWEHDLYSDEEKTETVGRILSFLLGTIFGRWETDEPLPTADDEIIVFNSPDDNDVSELIHESIRELYESPYEIREEMEAVLGKPVVDWLRENFFRYHHVKEYRRRGQRNPIYWHLESPDGTFSCFLYYHDIDANTLPKLRGQYVDERLDELNTELESVESQLSESDDDTELRQRKQELEEQIDDLREFRDRLDAMIDDDVEVDVEEGIWENFKEYDQYEVFQTGIPKMISSYER